ncbi:demethylmenaquinone methyltransferase [Parenemella sanctibonifatiensis]|uniref:Demethylmenaquinone methyltransferase n=1 Tax=Parenemella sanctibonifatiensis TaxID=2016505 RepID=A0A255EDJ2_9ACTN|nr:bifunctional demethylmenaquinone methyltransferase/2-methoxy-6-polyprenyl-1,4-benzoquinol methylase [Parenemella sanctibonifatiensis]
MGRPPRSNDRQTLSVRCGSLTLVPEEFRADLTKDHDDVASMFDGVARRYDLLNTLMTAGTDRRWRDAMVAAVNPSPGMRVLDLASGTGVSTHALREAGADAIATDLSVGMLLEGRRRHPEVSFVAADATQLPYADASFDAVTISFGLRNIAETQDALAEMRRVTRPGGVLVVNEFSRPTDAWFNAIYRQFLGTVIPQIARVSSNRAAYDYLAESIRAWPSQPELADIMVAAGWHDVSWRNLSRGIVALHRGRA